MLWVMCVVSIMCLMRLLALAVYSLLHLRLLRGRHPQLLVAVEAVVVAERLTADQVRVVRGFVAHQLLVAGVVDLGRDHHLGHRGRRRLLEQRRDGLGGMHWHIVLLDAGLVLQGFGEEAAAVLVLRLGNLLEGRLARLVDHPPDLNYNVDGLDKNIYLTY